MGRSEVSTSVVKWSEGLSNRGLTLLEDIQIIWSLLLTWLFRLSRSFILFWFCFYHCVYGCMFYMFLF